MRRSPLRDLASVASAASGPSSSLSRALLSTTARAGLFLALVAAVAGSGRAFGGYEPTAWGPLGFGLVAAVGALLASGRRPHRLVAGAGAALVALGAWSAASPAWGGFPGDAWKTLNQALLAAAAIVVGSLFATTSSRRRLVALGVLAGVAAQAVEVLAHVATGRPPEDWFHHRFLDGPVGYHNAQAAMFVLGLPLALWLVGSDRRIERIAGAIASGLLAGPLILTQSRGGLAIAGVAIALQLAATRSARLTAFVFPLVAFGAALAVVPLPPVDAALVEGTPAEIADALRTYAAWTGGGTALLAVLAAPDFATRWGRSVVAALAVGCLVAAIALAVPARPGLGAAAERVSSALADMTSDTNPDTAPPGQTRLRSASLNGRWDAWRVAWGMAVDSPVTGAGQGRFAAEWPVERRLSNLYVLQPHSLELELLSELGGVGLAAFFLFVAFAILSLRRSPDGPLAAAALATVVALLLQASVDWVWSFPALVAPTLLVVGAVAGGGSRAARLPLLRNAAWTTLAVAGLLSLVPPYLAARHVARAEALEREDVSEAWVHAESARLLNPWDAEVVALSGRLAEAAGRFELAAERYRAAARLSQRPWLQHYREARARSRAGDLAGARAACRRAVAANPSEKRLLSAPCRRSPR